MGDLLEFRVRVREERKFFDRYDRFTEVVGDQRKRPQGWQPNANVRLDYQRRHMDTEAAGGWVPLNDEYRLQKIEDVGTIPILQYTRHMYSSLTQEGTPDYVREESADSLKVGTSDFKARLHHEGRGRLPRREVIVITDAEGKQHLEVIEEDYESIARNLGFRVN
jgi:hypothetical protein